MNLGNYGRGIAALVTVGLLASGCTTDPPATPSPTPAVSHTPTVSQTPSESAQEMQQRLAYEAAEKSYRTFRAEYNRVLRAGGAKQATPVMNQTAGGSYLHDFVEVIQAAKGLGDYDKGEEKIVSIRPSGYSATSLLLEVCEDSRNVTTYDKDGKRLGVGEIRIAKIDVQKRGATWKLWSGQGERVSSCE